MMHYYPTILEWKLSYNKNKLNILEAGIFYDALLSKYFGMKAILQLV